MDDATPNADEPILPASFEWNELSLAEGMSYLKNAWAYIEIRVESAPLQLQETPVVIAPQHLIEDKTQFEFVYPIYDFGDRLIAIKDFNTGQSMLKMSYTIEKMVAIWSDKMKEKSVDAGGSELEVYLDGHLFCLRKAFEVIINLTENWMVMNFDPGDWGHKYLDLLQKLYEKGYPYPSSAPRDFYKHVQKPYNQILAYPGKS